MADQFSGGAPVPSTRMRVFVSYAQESDQHCDDVLELCALLRRHGVDPWLDRWHEDQRNDWSELTEAELLAADYVLVVGSPAHRRVVPISSCLV